MSNVEHPKHYNAHPSGVEAIAILEAFNFNVGNAMKYLWRAGLKNPTTQIEDLEKARAYVEFEIARVQREQPTAAVAPEPVMVPLPLPPLVTGDPCPECVEDGDKPAGYVAVSGHNAYERCWSCGGSGRA